MPAAADTLRSRAVESLRVLPQAALVGALAGAASALFLAALGRTTALHQAHGWLLYLSPLGGLAVVWLYRRLGGAGELGTDHILACIRSGEGAVPRRIAPLVLIGTLLSHLFGASVGREGTALQMGGGLGAAVAGRGASRGPAAAALLVAGMAGGFGSVFGTPWAGAVFAVEVAAIGRAGWRWLAPALVASLVGHHTCLALGAHHATYGIAATVSPLDLALLAKIAVAAVAFGLAARIYSGCSRGMAESLRRLAPSPYVRVLIGSAALIGLVHAIGSRDYLGLGVDSPDAGAVTLASAFTPGGAAAWSWWWKLVLTALCLAAGFRGGEVTPLFFVGATLGNVLAGALGAPADLLAGLGLVAVLAGAARAPLACIVLGIELFGPAHALPLALACLVARAVSAGASLHSAPPARA